MFRTDVAVILGVIHAIAATVLLYIMVLPKRKDGKLNAFLQQVHNFFNVKKLYLEEVLKFLYVLSSVLMVCVGFFMLLGYEYGYNYYGPAKQSTFLPGLLVMVLGPIALRLVYEGIMMFILLVKNTMEINNKIKDEKKEACVCEAAAPENVEE